MINTALALYLIPGLLVQVHTAIQWDPLNQLHGQNPAAGQLIDHFRDFKILVSLQQGPGDETKTPLKERNTQKQTIHTASFLLVMRRECDRDGPELLGALSLPLVVTLPCQLPLKDLKAAVCKET